MEEECGRLFAESVENVRTVASLGREQHFVDAFERVASVGFRRRLQLLHVQAFFYSLSNTIIYFVQCGVFSFGFYLMRSWHTGQRVVGGPLATADLFKIYGSMTFSTMVLGRVYAQLPDQRRSRQAAKTAFRAIERRSLIDALSDAGQRLPSVVGDIRFSNVHFAYPNRRRKILAGFNLTIRHGETMALVGPSGNKKSSFITLLLIISYNGV